MNISNFFFDLTRNFMPFFKHFSQLRHCLLIIILEIFNRNCQNNCFYGTHFCAVSIWALEEKFVFAKKVTLTDWNKVVIAKLFLIKIVLSGNTFVETYAPFFDDVKVVRFLAFEADDLSFRNSGLGPQIINVTQNFIVSVILAKTNAIMVFEKV